MRTPVETVKPCWPQPATELVVCDPCVDLGTTEQPGQDRALFDQAWAEAVSFVFDQTCRRWPGRCWTETLRPCPPRRGCGIGTHQAICRCGKFNSMPIQEGLVFELSGPVTITEAPSVCNPDGSVTVADPDDPATWGGPFRFERRRTGGLQLVAQANESRCQSWPRQNIGQPAGADGTWTVEARTGTDPPAHVLAATTALAAEIARECVVSGCLFVEGVSRITRLGVTIELNQERSPNSRLGILEKVIKDHGCKPADFAQFGTLPDAECWEWHPQSIPKNTGRS